MLVVGFACLLKFSPFVAIYYNGLFNSKVLLGYCDFETKLNVQ